MFTNENILLMKLPESLTTVNTLSKILASIIFIILPFLGFYLGARYQKNLNAIQISPDIGCNCIGMENFYKNYTPPATTPLPESETGVSATPSNQKSILDALVLDYDNSFISIERGTTNNVIVDNTHRVVPNLYINIKGLAGDVVEIVDLTSIEHSITSLDKVMSLSGIEDTTTLRSVNIKGKRYNFTRRTFAEGGLCEGGGGHDDFILVEGKLGVIVITRFTEVVTTRYTDKRCSGETLKREYDLDSKTVEIVLKVIESMHGF